MSSFILSPLCGLAMGVFFLAGIIGIPISLIAYNRNIKEKGWLPSRAAKAFRGPIILIFLAISLAAVRAVVGAQQVQQELLAASEQQMDLSNKQESESGSQPFIRRARLGKNSQKVDCAELAAAEFKAFRNKLSEMKNAGRETHPLLAESNERLAKQMGDKVLQYEKRLRATKSAPVSARECEKRLAGARQTLKTLESAAARLFR